MPIRDRLVDADVLWASGRREGAFFSVLVAVTALAQRREPDDVGNGEAFRRFISEAHQWNITIEHRGQEVTVDQLLWKWVRCEVAYAGDLPLDVQFWPSDDDPDDLRIQAGGGSSACVRISDGWYWWTRRQVENYVSTTLAETGSAPEGW